MAEELKQIFAKDTDNFILIGKITPDRMKLFVEIDPKTKAATRDEILAAIKERAPIEDVNIGVIDDMVKKLQSGEKVEDRRVLKGKPAENGADGKLLYLVKKFSGDVEVKVDAKGKAQFQELHLFDNVLKDQAVARIYPPKSGVDGKDVLGGVVKAEAGKPVKFTVDKSVRTENEAGHDYQVLKAEVAGYVTEDQGKICVKDELVIKGDLDFRFGTINFIGKVRVSGDVLPDFDISAKNGIEISGSVRGGSLSSTDGDIIVKGYVYGGKNSRVICGKNFTASVVQEINTEIAGNINILKESTDSLLRAQGAVMVSNGRIMGGEVYSVCGVEAKLLGNDAGLNTSITLCSAIETTLAYAKLAANLENHEKAEGLITLHLGPYATNPARIQLLTGAHREKMNALFNKLSEIRSSHKRLKAEREKLVLEGKQNDSLRVNYLGQLYPGTVIKVAKDTFDTKEILKGPGSIDYLPAEKKFVIGELKPLICSIGGVATSPSEKGALDTKQGSPGDKHKEAPKKV